MSEVQSPAAELAQLRKKRKTLERMMKIAEAIERLHHGLMAALLLGKQTHLIPKKTVESFEAMDEKTQMLPSQQLQTILEQLKDSIQEKLAGILRIAELDDGDLLTLNLTADGVDESPETLLKEYQKLSQTAVALRVLLHSRGERTTPTDLPVQADDIRQKISDIAQRENRCRNRVTQQVNHLIQDSEQLLKRGDLPEGMQEMLQGSIAAFQANLEHIKAGGNLQNLPVAMEIIEVADPKGVVQSDNVDSEDEEKDEMDVPSDLDEACSKEKVGFMSKIISWIKARFS